MKSLNIQTNFTAGEISPLMLGRVDTTKYASGASQISNFFVRPQGALWRRSGARHMIQTRAPEQKSIMIPFQQSDVAGYILEVGPGYIFVHKNNAPVLDISTVARRATLSAVNNVSSRYQCVSAATYLNSGINSVTAGSSGMIRITTASANNLRSGSKVLVGGTIASANGSWTVTYVSATSFDLRGSTWVGNAGAGGTVTSNLVRAGDLTYIQNPAPPGTSKASGYYYVKSVSAYNTCILGNALYASDVGGDPGRMWAWVVEMTTPYTESDLKDLYWVQSQDVMYICHPAYPVYKIYRNSDTSWTFTQVTFRDGPYLPEQSLAPYTQSALSASPAHPEYGTKFPDVEFQVSNYSHTATANALTNFAVADNGKYIEFRYNDQWRLAKVNTAPAVGTTASVDIIDNIMLFLDESTRVIRKPGSTYAPSNGAHVQPNTGVGNSQKVDPVNHVVGSSAGLSTNVVSNFTNTFGQQDVGKWVRFARPYVAGGNQYASYWWQIIKQVDTAQAGKTASLDSTGVVPVMVSNQPTGQFVMSNETITCAINALQGGVAAGITVFRSTDVGRAIRLGFGNRWTYGVISSYVSPTAVNVTLSEPMPRDPHDARNIAGNKDSSVFGSETGTSTAVLGTPTTGYTFHWRLGAWSGTTGYPSSCNLHEQRLFFHRTDTQPHTSWGSATADFENFTPTELDGAVVDDDAVSYTIASNKIQAIKWAMSGKVMLIGTNGGEWSVRSTSPTQSPLTPSNLIVVPETEHGSLQTCRPRRIGTSILYVNRAGQKLYQVGYEFDQDQYNSKDATIIGEHILRQGTSAIFSEFQHEPNSLYWLTLTDGTLACLTHNKDQEVFAWSRHSLGATSAGNATVEHIACIPSVGGNTDTLYMVVKRTINGSTYRSIEYFDDDFYPASSSDRSGMRFLDSATLFTSVVSTSIDCLDYLEGETVSYLADGVKYSGTVTSGVLDISANFPSTLPSVLYIGVGYQSRVKMLPAEGGQQGSAQGKTKRIDRFSVRVYNTQNVYFGSQSTNLMARVCIEPGLGTGFYSGNVRIQLDSTWDMESEWFLGQDLPEPCTILCVAPELHVNA